MTQCWYLIWDDNLKDQRESGVKGKVNIVNERLVSKEHYRYKVLILLMKSSAYFNKKPLSPPPLLYFFKNVNPLLISGGRVQTVRLIQRTHLCTYLVTGFEPKPLISEHKLPSTKLRTLIVSFFVHFLKLSIFRSFERKFKQTEIRTKLFDPRVQYNF